MIIPPIDYQALLAQLGWEDVSDYQAWNGLEITGVLDSPTKRELTAPRFCSVPDVLPQMAAGALPKWGFNEVKLAITGRLPGLTDEQLGAAFNLALTYWNEVCGIRLGLTDNASIANILAGSGRIDGPMGTLAWSELPNAQGTTKRLQQKYDTGEPWGVFDGPNGRSIDLVRVVCHEVGHALGISHGPAGCLMAPTISSIRKPQVWDINEARKRYGNAPTPTPEPEPPLPPVPPTPAETVIRIRGRVDSIEIPGYTVTRNG